MTTPKVFISHSSDDSEWVRAFAEALHRQEVEVWLDQWEIGVGDSLRDALESGLRQSDAIVAIVSPTNVKNPNIYFELGVALGLGKRLIPVVSQDLEVSSIPFDLRSRRYVLKGRPEDTAREVAAAVRESERGGKSKG